jgi:hypothetical protein
MPAAIQFFLYSGCRMEEYEDGKGDVKKAAPLALLTLVMSRDTSTVTAQHP